MNLTAEQIQKNWEEFISNIETHISGDRKQKLIDQADVILVLPGGIGTLDECLGAIAAKQLGEHSKPIILYNCYDYWSGFIEYLELLYEQRMISQNLSDLYEVVSTVEKLNEVLDGFLPS